MLAALGVLSVVSIGWAINDIYSKLDNGTLRLCVVEARQWDAMELLAAHDHVTLPPRPVLPRSCNAAPGIP